MALIIVSACLAGFHTTYRGQHHTSERIREMVRRGEAIPVCPEQLGGLATPRPPAEITGGTAEDVLKAAARVRRPDGADVTDAFLRGAREILNLALLVRPELVIFKEKSPSCGVSTIYDGSHSGKLIPGCGITTALLRSHGFQVVSDEEKVWGQFI